MPLYFSCSTYTIILGGSARWLTPAIPSSGSSVPSARLLASSMLGARPLIAPGEVNEHGRRASRMKDAHLPIAFIASAGGEAYLKLRTLRGNPAPR